MTHDITVDDQGQIFLNISRRDTLYMDICTLIIYECIERDVVWSPVLVIRKSQIIPFSCNLELLGNSIFLMELCSYLLLIFVALLQPTEQYVFSHQFYGNYQKQLRTHKELHSAKYKYEIKTIDMPVCIYKKCPILSFPSTILLQELYI